MNSVSLLSSYAAVRVRQCLYLLLFFSTVSIGLAQGTAVKVVFLAEPSGSTTANQPFATQPVVEIQDSGGSRVFTSATVAVSIAMNGGIFIPGTLFGITTLATVNGRATFSGLSIDKIGTYTLKVTSVGLATSTTSTFAITTGAPYRLVFHTEPENGIAGIPLNPQLVVRVQDEGGNHVGNNANTAVLLSVASGPEGIASIEQNPVYTFAGFATFSGLVLNAAGCYTLQALTSGLVSATSAVLCITSGAASITTSTVSAVVNTLPVGGSTSAVIVQLNDVFGNDVDDDADCVRLFVTSGPGAVTQIPAYIGSGRWAGIYTSNGMPGQVVVSAFLKPDGQSGCAFPGVGYAAIHDTVQLNVVAGVASATTSTITVVSAVVAEGESTTLTITLRDSFGNPTTNGTIMLAMTQGSGSLSTTAVSGAATTASVVYTASSNVSAATVTARITGEDIVYSPLMFVVEKKETNPCNKAECKTTKILLNTGFDHKAVPPAVYDIGALDKYWGVVDYQHGNAQRYAYVGEKAQNWPASPDPPVEPNRWLWAVQPVNGIDTGCRLSTFYTEFQVCDDSVRGTLDIYVMAPYRALVLLNNRTLFHILEPGTPETHHNTIVTLRKGVNRLSIRSWCEAANKARAINVKGSITSVNAVLIDRKCFGELQAIQGKLEPVPFTEGASLDSGMVTLIGPSTTTQATTTSDGEYSFLVSELGSYTVQVEPPLGYCMVYGTMHTVAVSENDSIPELVSGVSSSAQVCIQKFHDQNGNGVQDGGEPNLSNWTFVLLNSAASIVVTTGTAGTVCTELSTGNWAICEVTQAGWSPTTPACTTITVSACSSASVAFGNIATSTASGLVVPSENLWATYGTPAVGADDILRSVTAVRKQEQSGNPHLKSVPNPTSGETTISYVLSQPSTVRLDVYTMIGTYIGTVEEGQRTEGEYRVPFSLRELPSGFYHVRLTVDNQVYTLMVINNK